MWKKYNRALLACEFTDVRLPPWLTSKGYGARVKVCRFQNYDANLQNNETKKAANVSLVKQLLECQANLKINNSNYGQSLLHVAVKLDFTEVCAVLVDHGTNLEEADHEGNTPLILATKKCKPSTISSLLERGAKIDACDKQGLTPLLVAIKTGNLALVEQLLKHGAI